MEAPRPNQETYTDYHYHGRAIGGYTLTGKDHGRNWRRLTDQENIWEKLEGWTERWAQLTDTLADRHPKITWGITAALLLASVSLIPSLISTSNEADRILQELEASRALRGAIVVPAPNPEAESTPVPRFEPQPAAPSSADYFRKAYLELVIPTKEGKSVAEIMAELGYKFYPIPDIPIPDIPKEPYQLRAGDIGNVYRRVPLNWPERKFFDRFQTLNIVDSINVKEPFPSFTILPIGDPRSGVIEFYALTDKGWVNIAQVNYNQINLFIQDPGSEVMEILNKYKIQNLYRNHLSPQIT